MAEDGAVTPTPGRVREKGIAIGNSECWIAPEFTVERRRAG